MEYQEQFKLFKNGNQAFFEKLYFSLNESCRKYILKRGGDTNVADEVLQESFFILLEKVKVGKIFELNQPIEAYIFGFVKNIWQEKRRKSTKYKNLHHNLDSDEDWLKDKLTEEAYEQEFFKENIKSHLIIRLLDDLGVNCKEILLSFHVEKQSLKDIAEKLNKTYEYIKLRRFRCAEEMKNKYEAASKTELKKSL